MNILMTTFMSFIGGVVTMLIVMWWVSLWMYLTATDKLPTPIGVGIAFGVPIVWAISLIVILT